MGDCRRSDVASRSSSSVTDSLLGVAARRISNVCQASGSLLNNSLVEKSTRWRTSLRSLFQSVSMLRRKGGPWASLLIKTGVRPLDRNNNAKLVLISGVLSHGGD